MDNKLYLQSYWILKEKSYTNNMDVLKGGVVITARNTVFRLRGIFVWFITKAGTLLLKLPLACLRFLARLGNYILDYRNRKVMIVVLTLASVIIASRGLVN